MHDPEELVERRKAAKAARTAAAPQFDGRRLVALGRGDGRSCAELAALSGLSESEVRRRIAAELVAEAEDRAARESRPSRAHSRAPSRLAPNRTGERSPQGTP
ncbi:MAG: hypothetical protein ACK52I_16520 [Pseudomonadota bacterium]|jgi:hypothetical protein